MKIRKMLSIYTSVRMIDKPEILFEDERDRFLIAALEKIERITPRRGVKTKGKVQRRAGHQLQHSSDCIYNYILNPSDEFSPRGKSIIDTKEFDALV